MNWPFLLGDFNPQWTNLFMHPTLQAHVYYQPFRKQKGGGQHGGLGVRGVYIKSSYMWLKMG